MDEAVKRTMLRFRGMDIAISRKDNCGRLILRAQRGAGCFTLTAPRRMSEEAILLFLRQNEEWLRAHQAELSAWQPRFETGERHWAFGQLVTLGQGGVPEGEAFLRWRQQRLEDWVKAALPGAVAAVGRAPASVTFREMKTRWGSCTPKTGRIRLSTRLAQTPEACVRYVLYHELCHLLVPNHSAALYRELDRVCPAWRTEKRWLTDHSLSPLPPEGN